MTINCTRRSFLTLAAGCSAAMLAACGNRKDAPATTQAAATGEKVDLKEFEKLAIDMGAWQYDEDNKVWWQTGITYCLSPASETYEQVAIYVPGAYLKGKKSGSKYACEVDDQGKVGDFTAKTAPIVMPLNPGAYAGQAASTAYSYDGLSPYLDAGLIYVYAGFRGRNNGYDSMRNEFFPGGAPWGVTDLKAAIRYLRYNASKLPGNMERIVTFGFAGSGQLSQIVAASGDAEAYDPYLAKIGAATHDAEGNDLSDAVFGSASWCPSTSFDSADAAYEWSMGQYDSTVSRAEKTWTESLSHDLAVSYAGYVNKLGLVDADDTALTLDETSGGTYVAGTYYDHLRAMVADAASAFFKKQTFPYVADTSEQADGCFPGDGNLKVVEQEAIASAATTPTADGATALPTFETRDAYVAWLNEKGPWLTYNESRREVTVGDLGSFVRRMRPASREVCAIDSLDRDQPANQLFGNDDDDSLHFDGTICALLSQNADAYSKLTGWDEKYLKAWTKDLAATDSLDTKAADRVRMYDPMFFLSGYYEDGFGKAKVAPNWRVNTGLNQTAVPLTSEVNLVAALGAYDGVDRVDFTPVWGVGRTLAERSGKPAENFVKWVCDICKTKKSK